MSATVNTVKALRKLEALGNVLHRPLRDVLDSGARVCAISLTKSTQPDGTGEEAKKQGEAAVARDIRSIYGKPGDAYKSIRNTYAQAIFWKAYKAGDMHVAEHTLQAWSSKYIGTPMEKFDGGHKHLALRRTRRPVVFKPAIHVVIVTNPEKLTKYIKKMQDGVGTAKGGWADCVRAIGGTIRGLRNDNDITASWITAHRKAGGFGAAHRGGTDQHPTINITNRVPYIRQMLSQSAEQYAKNVAHGRMVENLQHAIKAEVTKLRTAA